MVDESGLVTKCSYCEGIQDPETDVWVSPSDKQYDLLSQRYDGSFSHGVCSPCNDKERARLTEFKRRRSVETNVQ